MYLTTSSLKTALGEGDNLGSLLDYEIAEKLRKIDNRDYSSISELLCRFEGVNIGGINSSGLLTNWWISVKSIILYSMIYLMVLSSEGELTDLMNDLSLKM